MRYYIDGHNVLGALGLPGDERSIQVLTAKLTAYQIARHVELVLVFDNFRNDNPYMYFQKIGNLQVFASDPNVDEKGADDCIIRLLKGKPDVGTVTIVTADRGLKDELRKIGVNNFMSPIDFTNIVERAFTKKVAKNTTFAPSIQDDSKDDDLTDKQRREINEEMSRVFGESDQYMDS